jgi:hypothetical protein
VGPRRLAFELGKASITPVPSRSTIYRVLVRHGLVAVTIETGDTTLRVIDQHGELITTVPRANRGEISRFKAYGTRLPLSGPDTGSTAAATVKP